MSSTLADRQVHVWLAALDLPTSAPIGVGAADADADVALLTADERERARHIAREPQRRRWARSRGVLRLLLGEYLNADPTRLRFEPDERGKPRLAGADAWLEFNMGRSNGVALYAFGRGLSLGVDVETLDTRGETGRQRDWVAVGRRAFGDAGARHLGSFDGAEREREFLRLWVRHEAQRKCSGAGLAGSGDLRRTGGSWVADLDLGERALAAVSAPREPVELTLHSLSHDGADQPEERPALPVSKALAVRSGLVIRQLGECQISSS